MRPPKLLMETQGCQCLVFMTRISAAKIIMIIAEMMPPSQCAPKLMIVARSLFPLEETNKNPGMFSVTGSPRSRLPSAALPGSSPCRHLKRSRLKAPGRV